MHGRAGAKPDRTVLQTVKAHKGPDGEVEFDTTVAVDISEQKRLERERVHLLSIIEETPAFVATPDARGNVLYYNRAARDMLGMSPDEDARGVRIRETHPEWAARIVFEKGLPAAVRDGQWQGETAILTRDGREIPVLQVIVAHKDETGEVMYYSTIVQDITERKLMEERLHYLATHDALTGLINRTRFQQLLREELVHAKQSGTPGAVLHLDLDNFKDVNDSLGHHIGDRLLRRLARLLQEQLREGDRLARLGGDEFALLLPRTDLETAVTVGEQVLQAVGEEVVLLDDKMIRMRASIGVATYPSEASKVEDVLIHADLSMYAAKRLGGQRLSVYDMGAEGRFRAESRLNLERLCREAVQRQLFVLHWQPLLNLQTGATATYELLLRLRDEEGRLIPPLQFLPVCERSDIIHEVDRWVIGEAISLVAALESVGAPRVDLHVNLSQRTLSDEELIPFVRQRLEQTGADGSRIVLELTETAAVENVNTAAEFIRGLRKLGLRFAGFPVNASGGAESRTVLQTVVAHRNADGEVEFYSTAAIDIGAERRLEAERSRLLTIMEETPDFVASADSNGRVFYLNRAARRQLGLGPEEPGERIRIKDLHPDWAYRLITKEGLPGAVRDGTWRGDTALRGQDGREIPVLQVIVAHKNASGNVQYYSTIMRDITERKRMEETLHHRATRDSLTGALNRGSFVEAVEGELARARVTHRRGSVLSLDLDKFKEVNDTFGHHAGDIVLQHIVRVAQGKVRKGDVVGRLGGDEFAVLLPEADPTAAVTIAKRLLARLRDDPPQFDGMDIPVRISIGIAPFPDGVGDAEALLRRADEAMYRAKASGGSGHSVYTGS